MLLTFGAGRKPARRTSEGFNKAMLAGEGSVFLLIFPRGGQEKTQRVFVQEGDVSPPPRRKHSAYEKHLKRLFPSKTAHVRASRMSPGQGRTCGGLVGAVPTVQTPRSHHRKRGWEITRSVPSIHTQLHSFVGWGQGRRRDCGDFWGVWPHPYH